MVIDVEGVQTNLLSCRAGTFACGRDGGLDGGLGVRRVARRPAAFGTFPLSSSATTATTTILGQIVTSLNCHTPPHGSWVPSLRYVCALLQLSQRAGIGGVEP